MLISVVIVNYNGARYLPACLDALARQTLPRYLWEIVLIDHGSADGSAELVKSRYPWVRLVEAGENLGFAGGNLRGLRYCHGGLIALINNDTEADPYWLEALAGEAERYPSAGAVAAKLVFHADPGMINSAGMDLLADAHGTDRAFRQRDAGHYEASRPVFGACGAGVMFRRSALDRIGFLDQRYFMYYEDADLSWRLRSAGYQVRFCPDAVVRHIHCGSSGEWSPFFTRHVERNRVATAIQNGDRVVAGWALFSYGSRLRKALQSWAKAKFSRDRSRYVKAYSIGVVDLIRWLPRLLAERYNRRVRGVGRCG